MEGASAPSLFMKKILYDVTRFGVVGMLCWGAFILGSDDAVAKKQALEQTDFCYDTPKYEAWVAKKGNFYRCFMERREYPHRVRASHIEIEETK